MCGLLGPRGLFTRVSTTPCLTVNPEAALGRSGPGFLCRSDFSLLTNAPRFPALVTFPTPAQGGHFGFFSTFPRGDGKAQRCQVTHPKVTQQINSRGEGWPAPPQPGCFPFLRAVQTPGAAKGMRSRAVPAAPWNKGQPLAWWRGAVAAGDTLASAYTWRKDLQHQLC